MSLSKKRTDTLERKIRSHTKGVDAGKSRKSAETGSLSQTFVPEMFVALESENAQDTRGRQIAVIVRAKS